MDVDIGLGIICGGTELREWDSDYLGGWKMKWENWRDCKKWTIWGVKRKSRFNWSPNTRDLVVGGLKIGPESVKKRVWMMK